MEGPGGESGFAAPAVGVAPEPPEPPGPPRSDDAPARPAPDRPGLARRVAWWVVGPLLVAAMLAVSLVMVLGSPTTMRTRTPADALAVGLLLVSAAALLFRRRWPLE